MSKPYSCTISVLAANRRSAVSGRQPTSASTPCTDEDAGRRCSDSVSTSSINSTAAASAAGLGSSVA